MAMLRSMMVAVMTMAGVSGLQAQSFPAKPVRILVGFSAGGGNDLTARVMAPKLNELWGQPVVVENRTGASGNIAAELVAKSPADGHTLLMGYNGTLTINPALYAKLPFDVERDFTPIALAVVSTNMLVSHPSLPVKSVKELVAFAKARPGQLNFASAGVGSVGHLAAELLNMTAGIKLQHIPYKGNGAAIADVLGGQVPLMFSAPAAVVEHARSGKLRGLAVASERRPPGLQDIPTFAEAGFKGVEASAWFALFGPAGMPPALVERINADAVRVLKQPDVATRLTNAGYDPMPTTAAEMGRILKADLAKWGKVVKASGAKAE
jgi:tripartite-type tricarboxylate transporter receptor subunit TctC